MTPLLKNKKKSRIRETKDLSTDVDRSTNIFVSAGVKKLPGIVCTLQEHWEEDTHKSLSRLVLFWLIYSLLSALETSKLDFPAT